MSDNDKDLTKMMDILENDIEMLQNYMNKVNVTFSTLLAKSKFIMEKDLSEIVDSISVEESMQSLSCQPSINTKMLNFPQCKISKSASELLELIKEILVDCEIHVESYIKAHSIVELYCDFVPKHHELSLDNPQQAAIFHNNCMYLAHHLTTLGLEKRGKTLGESPSSAPFEDLVPILRILGTDAFMKSMHMQQNRLLDIIRNSGLAALEGKKSVAPGTEKIVRGGLKQLDTLKSVWLTFLPLNVYCKAMGCLINSLLDELINAVTSVENMPSEMATRLGKIYQLVTFSAPRMFPEPDDVQCYASKWAKFQEVVIILASSMQEIVNRWNKGNGTLASFFTPDQVQKFICARFRKTDRRNLFISCIKYLLQNPENSSPVQIVWLLCSHDDLGTWTKIVGSAIKRFLPQNACITKAVLMLCSEVSWDLVSGN